MIDKKIYYCWFGGGEMSELNKKCMESWKKYCPDYQIIEINESNYDWESNPYAKANYEAGNWSGVSNAARLFYLINNNGFYLDTDVELVQSLDSLREYDAGFITEFECGQPDSGVLGRGEICPNVYTEAYERLVPGTILHKEFIQILYRDYDIKGQQFRRYDDGFVILGEEYFPTVRTGLFTYKTVGIHYFENTWFKNMLAVTDGFYPFPRIQAVLGTTLKHKDENPEVVMVIKNRNKKWHDADMLGKICYFFNPKVVKLINPNFYVERIGWKKDSPTLRTETLITPSGLIVTYII